MSFSNVKQFCVDSESAVELKMPDYFKLDGKNVVVLMVKYAGRDNKEFLNASLELAARSKIPSKKRKMDADAVMEALREDMESFSKTIIVGWKHVVDDKGREVEFSSDVCLEFLEQMDMGTFEWIRQFCINRVNFLNSGAVPKVLTNEDSVKN